MVNSEELRVVSDFYYRINVPQCRSVVTDVSREPIALIFNGQRVFQIFNARHLEMNVFIRKLVSVLTDGAAVIIGENIGLIVFFQ